MGFFDRFKKKKEEKKQQTNQTSYLSGEDELLRKYNEAMRSIDEEEAELDKQWREVDAKISSGIKNLNNSPGARRANELAAAQARKIQEEMRQKEFEESLLGQKYATIRHYVNLKKLGLQPGSNFSQEIRNVARVMEERGYSLDCLLLPFLIEKRAKNLLDSTEKRELDSIVSKLSDEELSDCLKDAVGLILYGGVLGPFETNEDQEKAKLFISSFIELDYLDEKMGRSKR